ncbi:hypothetical protein E2I00_005407 [Balaenoptera physalus]|uniref:Uncharacterized protein n=1 Tax=Balaenoptera physalus TaxID=9770 RepID=A0A6A1QAJ7_BALPH|nr:hypothetical protein E2I00_005407 [Balaenoptera physalus]
MQTDRHHLPWGEFKRHVAWRSMEMYHMHLVVLLAVGSARDLGLRVLSTSLGGHSGRTTRAARPYRVSLESVATRQVSSPQVLVWHTRTEKVNLANEPKYHLDAVTIEV